jgi:transposase
LLRLGAAKQQSPKAWRLVKIKMADTEAKFEYSLLKDKLRKVRGEEGRYLMRSNLSAEDPERLWKLYIQLTHVEEAFKHLKGDLAIRPFHHQKQLRIEAHIFLAFMAYCLHVTLARRLEPLAPGLTPRAVLEKFSAMQMIDVHLPTTDGREVILSRYTEPEKDQKILLQELKLQLPDQPPPKILAPKEQLA